MFSYFGRESGFIRLKGSIDRGAATNTKDAKIERFRAKHALGRDPGVDTGSREENASKQQDRARS
jgi:hypothetical protein